MHVNLFTNVHAIESNPKDTQIVQEHPSGSASGALMELNND